MLHLVLELVDGLVLLIELSVEGDDLVLDELVLLDYDLGVESVLHLAI